jgi:hypothetical protein
MPTDGEGLEGTPAHADYGKENLDVELRRLRNQVRLLQSELAEYKRRNKPINDGYRHGYPWDDSSAS